MDDEPDTTNDLWSIRGARLLRLLHLAYDGADPGLLYAEEYANSIEDPDDEDDEEEA